MKRLLAAAVTVALALRTFAADQPAPALVTNSFPVPGHGAVEIVAPRGWLLLRGATNGVGRVPLLEFHSREADIAVQFELFWDGYGTTNNHPSLGELERKVKLAVERTYAPVSLEMKVVMEKLHGPHVDGSFARFTDPKWVGKEPPVGEYRNTATGMFRTGDVWGDFSVHSNDKDGPLFKQGLKIVESIQKAP